ncbi:MAG: transferase [Lentisphaerae bacterium GWF2_45_14]|nr:MAG: transferase [Lentisphaerae bacterium GWF2_45_14]
MPEIFNGKLGLVKELINSGLDPVKTMRIMKELHAPEYPAEYLEKGSLYSECLPKGHDCPFTLEQRCLHFLWDSFDKLPLCLIVNFSIPFRRAIAEKLFKKCGAALISEENVRFNFGQNISVGERVFFNRNIFLDSKGGISIGNQACIAEDVKIFTHSHSESSHITRDYKEVVIKDYAKIYAGATILPGVMVGEGAIVASGSLVTKDVEPGTVVAGIPAKFIRERHSEEKANDSLDHIWLY